MPMDKDNHLSYRVCFLKNKFDCFRMLEGDEKFNKTNELRKRLMRTMKDKGRTNAEKFNRTDKRSDTRTPLTKKERQIRQRLKSNERFNKTGEQRGMRTP